MLSKNKIKYIHSLEQKKTRKEEQVFLAEGPKLVGDLLLENGTEFYPWDTEWNAGTQAAIHKRCLCGP